MIDIEIILTETLREDYRLLPKPVKKKFDKITPFFVPKSETSIPEDSPN